MDDTGTPPTTRATPGQVERDEARIRSEIAGTDGGIDPFTAAVRATRMPMIITDPRQPDNPIVFVNDAFCRLTGYAREDIVGRNCRFLQGPETNPDVVQRLREAIAAPRSIEIDIRNHRKDGTAFWNRLLMAPVHDANGTLAYFFASQLDVTLERERLALLEDENAALTAERRAYLQRLAFSEESRRLATDAAEVGTWDWDLTTDVLTWSDRTKAMFGFSPDAVCSMADFYAGLHPDDVEATSVAFASALDPERRATYDVDYRTIGKEDGIVRWVAAKGRGLFDESGRCVRALGTAIDITARKLAEEALRASEARARANADRVQLALAAGAIIGTWFWDPVTDRFTVDDAFASTFGLDPDLPRDGITLAHIMAAVHPDDQAGLAAAISEASARGGAYAHQYRTRRADGRYSWLEANGRVDQAPDGTALSFPGVLIDIEERRAVEAERARVTEELRSLNATLEERVEERTARLLEAEAALRQSQKLEAVGQLTGGVAHDFNNLLTIIRSSVDFLRRPDLPEERRRRYMDAVSDTVDRATKLTGQLLAFARRQALKPEVFEAGARLKSVTDMLDTVTGSRIRVLTDLPDRPCFVLADVSQFETALINMAVNARDAMDGEGTLTVRLSCACGVPPIRGHAGNAVPFAAISLADTGIGIAADRIGRIFEPFYTTKEVGKGTGLGLSQVFGFAKQSGGDVDVESAEGQGTTFTLYLPEIAAEPERTRGELVDAVASTGSGQRVLVVEDNIEVGRFATQILHDLGYETVWAANAEEALDRLGADGAGFDIVFSDVVMPGMGGVALAKLLRQRLPHLPVVLTSGYSDVLAQEGTSGFELLQKPYAADNLGRTLNRTMQRRMAEAASA